MLNIVLFRTDLRIDHNHLLQRVYDLKEKCIPLYILDLEEVLLSEFMNPKRLSCLIESLVDLDLQLQKYGSKLIILKGKPIDIIRNLSSKSKFRLILSKHYSTRALERGENIKSLVKGSGGIYEEIKNNVIYDNEDKILTQKGEPVKVFTFFKSQWLNRLKSDNFSPLLFNLEVNSLFYPLDEIQKLLDFQGLQQIRLEEIKHLIIDTGVFHGGSKYAQSIWKEFLEKKINNYSNDRNFLDLEGTSKLSLHLKWGTISPHQIAKDCIKILGSSFHKFREFKGTSKESVEVFLSEIIWREFYKYIHAIYPHIEKNNFNEKFDSIKWENDEVKFDAWCNGKTGYPIVDACMRQLNETGWMHNRGRMIVASFLCKDLHIDWRWGEEYFHKKLIDYDLALNNGGWQWTAGTGTDSSPYFRIFNPTEQAKKFDLEGHFIRKYIPEINELSDKFIHEPHLHIDFYKNNYPMPLVDHSKARKITLDLYKV